ncbi:hypothetical protein ACXIVK_27790 [Paraburkholderia caledonica]
MNQFLLRPLKPLGKVTDEQVDELRAAPGVRVSRVLTYIIAVNFDGGKDALQSLLAGSSWDTAHIGPSRTYRIQPTAWPVPVQSAASHHGPQLDDVLMNFAYECSLPTHAHLQRYIEAFPHFREDLIVFAAGLILDHLYPEPDDDDTCV